MRKIKSISSEEVGKMPKICVLCHCVCTDGYWTIGKEGPYCFKHMENLVINGQPMNLPPSNLDEV